MTLTFLSPVEPGDLRRQSMPLSYITAEVRSTDGAAHAVQLYFDISGEWASGDSGTKIGWSQEQVSVGRQGRSDIAVIHPGRAPARWPRTATWRPGAPWCSTPATGPG